MKDRLPIFAKRHVNRILPIAFGDSGSLNAGLLECGWEHNIHTVDRNALRSDTSVHVSETANSIVPPVTDDVSSGRRERNTH